MFKILDLTAGNRAIWFNKKHPDALYIDIRESVKPDLIANSKKLPLEEAKYYLVVFDPPHMNCGPNSNMSKVYGYHTTKEIYSLIEGAGKEAHRLTMPCAFMALKWNDHDIPLKKVFELMPDWEPLFGHITKDGPGSKTYWAMLRRINPAAE